MAKIRANIYDKAYVPSLGRGPFTNKVIHEELFRSLKRLGYVVENADEAVSDSLIFDEVDEGFLIGGEGTTAPESPAGGGEGTQQPEPPKDETVVSPEPPKGDTDSGTEQLPQTDDNESVEHPKDEAGTEQQPSVGDGNENTDQQPPQVGGNENTEQQPSVGDGDSVQTPNTDVPKVDETEEPKEETGETPKVDETEEPKEETGETSVETTEESKVDTVEAPKADTVEEPKVETTEAKKDVENKVELTDEEVKFLTGNARRQEIIDLLTEKGVHIENENATIAELLNLVGLTRK